MGRFEAQLLKAEFLKENAQDTDQMSKGQIALSYHAFNLVELGQVRCFEVLVAEDSVCQR